MARHLHRQSHLSIDDLERRYRAAKEPHERSWWQILWLLSQGHTAIAVAAVTGYSAYWIGQIAKRYNTEGPAGLHTGLHNRRHTTSHRHPPAVSPARQEELRQAVAEAAARHEHRTGREAAAWIGARLGHPVTSHLGWRYLVRAKQSLQVPRPRHALADAEQQADFKKRSGPC